MIVIGHSAYTGYNAQKIVATKAAAVNELRHRGVTRNDARQAVNAACQKPFGWTTVRKYIPGMPDVGNLIEVCNRPDIQ